MRKEILFHVFVFIKILICYLDQYFIRGEYIIAGFVVK